MKKKLAPSFLRVAVKVFVIGLTIFVILNLAARTSGVGYTSTDEPLTKRVFSFGRTQAFGYYTTLHLKVSYNPALFPISYLSGNGTYSGITWAVHYPEENAGQVAALIRVREEVTRNLPYLLAFSFVSGLILEELTFYISRPQREKQM